jgi:MFS family permease
VVVGNFFTLWVTQYAIEQGMSTAEGVAKAGMLFGIIQVSALLWAFFMGLIADRINRVTSLIVALGFATVGYSLMGQVEDPFGPALIPIAILLGIGEVSVIVGGGALLGQEAQVTLRGAIIGLFNLLGGIGIMAAATAGGIIFDSIARNAPFTMMGIMNGLLLLCAVLVRVRAGEPGGTRAAEPA